MIWARLQTGRKTSLCSHLKVDVRRSASMWRAKWPQAIALRRKAWRAKVRPLLPDKTRQDKPYQDKQGNWKQAWRTTSKEMGNQCVPSPTSLLKPQAEENGKMCAGKKDARGGNIQGNVDTAREKKGEISSGGDAKRHLESAADEVSVSDGCGRRVSTSQSTIAKSMLLECGNRHHLDLSRGEQLRRPKC